MAMERPAVAFLKFFCCRLSYIMKYSCPAEPQIIRVSADIINYL